MKLSSNVVSCTTGEDESKHLYPKVKLNNEANEYAFDQALINWYNAGLSEQRSNISGDASSHITLTNNVYKIDNYPFGAISGNLDFGGGWILYYSYSENTHSYNRDFQSYSWDLKYNGNSVASTSGGTTSPKEIIVTFSNNGNGTASIILFSSIGDYMYNQIYQWNTYNTVLTPSGNNAILFHDYLKTHQK